MDKNDLVHIRYSTSDIRNHMAQTVSILGCGWLGLPLGKFLAEKGFTVKGSTTRPEKMALLQEAGIQPFVLSFQPHPDRDQLDDLPDFLNSEILIVAIPPQVDKQGEDYHPLQIRHLSEHLKLSTVEKVIYISSTSVYPENNREATEKDELTGHDPASRAILRAEELIEKWHRDWTILRCGGLMGYDRIAGKYVAGKKDITTGDAPVNFVHRDDVIGIIYEVIRQGKWNQVYNVVAPQHPKRKDVYARNAEDYGFQLPEYAEGNQAPYKIISSAKLSTDLRYSFQFPDPLEFSYAVKEK